MRAHQRAIVSTSSSLRQRCARSSGVVSTFIGLPVGESTIFCCLSPVVASRIGVSDSSASSGLNTRHSSGFTTPFTTFSPSPHAPVSITSDRNPVSVSSVNATPAAPTSLRTICCTPTDSATVSCAMP